MASRVKGPHDNFAKQRVELLYDNYIVMAQTLSTRIYRITQAVLVLRRNMSEWP